MEMNTGEFEESYDHLKLAAYEFAEAAGLEVKNMEKLMRAFKRLHEYCHEEMEKDEYMGF